MRLINSYTENEFRNSLISSNYKLFNSGGRLLEVLKNVCPEMITAYVLNWIPEQGEDLFTILINEDMVVKLELDKYSVASPIVAFLTVAQYEKNLPKQDRIKLAVAIDLARRDMRLK